MGIIKKLILAVALTAATSVAAYAETTLELWTFVDPAGTNARSKALHNVISTFEAKNPDIKIKTTIIAWNEINLAVLKAARSGKVPDLAMLLPARMPRQIAAEAIQPLDKYLDKMDKKDRDDIILLPSTISEGKHYSVPYEIRLFGFLYRKDLLDKLGLKRPESLDELVADAKKMQDMEGSDFVGIGLGFDPTGDSAEKFFVPAVYGLGGHLFNKDGTAHFNNPEAIKVVNWLVDIIKKDKVMPLDIGLMSPDKVQRLVEAGRCGFFFQGSHWVVALNNMQKNGPNLDFMPVPSFTKGMQPGLVDGWQLSIPTGAKNPDAAWKLIMHWTSPDIQLMQSTLAGYGPMRRSLADAPELNTPKTAFVKEVVQFAGAHPAKIDWPENTDAVQDTLSRAVEAAMTGKETPEQALKEAEKNYNSMRN
jgi:ABC-type glycerol-3-phosphate transport system substrate-binding protein